MEVQVVFSQQLRRFSRWLRNDCCSSRWNSLRTLVAHMRALGLTRRRRQACARKRSRHITVEAMEPRLAMTADPIWVGGVYIEEDSGSDMHGDSFQITFKGGAAGTQLTRLTIDGD